MDLDTICAQPDPVAVSGGKPLSRDARDGRR
jgi:hypothetical protein